MKETWREEQASRSTGRGRYRPVAPLVFFPLALLILGRADRPSGGGPDSSSLRPPHIRFDSIRTNLEDYLWPTDAGKVVTSTFAEYRRAHFHAGIDISCNVTGYRVLAARNGYVSRIRISPEGYGKILYLRHADGYTTTYAHLARFSPAIDARASAEQRSLGSYAVDIECGPSEFPVRKGDVIAISGKTGANSPHLHFEIRDENGDPVNPFLCAPLRIKDNIPPTISSIALVPLSPGATVGGAAHARTYHPTHGKGTTLRIAEPIVITGETGFAVATRDRIPGSRFRSGIYSDTLFIDGNPVFAVRRDRTPWEETHEIGLCYEPLRARGAGRFERLYIDSPNHLPFYRPRGDHEGTIDDARFAPGPHTFRIVCADFSGNSTCVSGRVIVSRPPSLSAEREGDQLRVRLFDPSQVRSVVISSRGFGSSWSRKAWQASGRETLLPLPTGAHDIVMVRAEDRWGTLSSPRFIVSPPPAATRGTLALTVSPGEEFVEVRLTAGGILTAPPEVFAYEGSNRTAVLMSALSEDEYAGWFRPRDDFRGTRRVAASAPVNGFPAEATAEFDLYPILPGTSGTLELDSGNLVVRYDSLSVLKPLFLRLEQSGGEEGPVFRLGPEDAILGDGLQVTLLAHSAKTRRGLFLRHQGGWQFIGSRANGASSLNSGRVTTTLGELTLLTDETPPMVTRFRVRAGGRRQPEVSFGFRDDLSGVEYDELKLYIDGRTVIPEVDGGHHRAVYRVTEPLKRGPHQVTIRLNDRMGNSSTTERRFVLP